jgi:predicted nucleic acid-binding protein
MANLLRHTDLVVDASVAVKWHLRDEDQVAEAALVLERFADGDLQLFAPTQIQYEVASAITAATIGQNPRLSQADGQAAIEEFLAINISLINDQDIIVDAYNLVHQYGCAIYDAIYLALSQKLDIPLIIADHRLYNRIYSLPNVIWIGDYQ